MKHFQEFLATVKHKSFTVTQTKKGEKIKQTEHRQLKSDFMSALLADLEQEGVAIGMSKDGIVLELPNSREGAIPATLDVKIKSLDFDTRHEVELFEEEQKIKEQNRKKRKKDAKSAYEQATKAREK